MVFMFLKGTSRKNMRYIKRMTLQEVCDIISTLMITTKSEFVKENITDIQEGKAT